MQLTIFCKLLCVHGFDWSILTRFCWKLVYMLVILWHMSKVIDFLKITIGSCKFMPLAVICKYICEHSFD